MKIKNLIVGCGLSGIILAERLANISKEEVLIIDKKNHIAGTCFDYKKDKITIQKYGPHIFHTNSKIIWDYLSTFTDWNPFFLKPLVVIDGEKYNLPFNLNSIDKIFPEIFAKKITSSLIGEFGYSKKINVFDLKNSLNNDIKFLGDFVFEKIFKHYSEKQWSKNIDEIDPEILKKIKISINKDNRYFDDNSSDLIGQIPLPMGGGMTDEGNNIWSYDFSANNFTLDDNETYIITFSAYWGLDFSTSFGKDYRTFDLIIGKDCFGDMVYLTGEKLEDEYFPYIAEWINADPAVYATPVRVTSEGNVNGELLPKGETFYSLFCTFVDRYSMGIDDSIPLNGKTQKQTVDDLAKTLGLTEEERDRALKETGFTEKNGSWERSSAP